MLKITITAFKSIKLEYGLIIKIKIIHICPKWHYDSGLKRKLEFKKISPWAEYRVPRYLLIF